jgi:hypothetical protein
VDYLRKAGNFALTQGYLSAGVDVLQGVAKALTIGSPSGASPTSDPTRIGALY